MANDATEISEPGDGRIDMNDAWQVLGWCRHFSLTKTQLEAAVRVAGTAVADIEAYLAGQKQPGKPLLSQSKPDAQRRNIQR